ncbi:MAG: hypothetical protein AABZ60_10080 [Planctomycetota bacterium]
MYRIFFALAMAMVLFFLLTLWTGHTKAYKPQENLDHFSSGLITCICGVGLHTLVIIYFVGTGRTIKAAILQIQLPIEFLQRSNQWYKSRGFLWAGLSCLLLVTTLVLGGALDSGRSYLFYFHRFTAYFTVAFNLFTFVYEYRAIKKNKLLLRDIDVAIEKLPLNPVPLPVPANEVPAPFMLGQKLVFYAITLLFPYVFLKNGWGWNDLSFWPFFTLCLLLMIPGIFLKILYRPSTWKKLEIKN